MYIQYDDKTDLLYLRFDPKKQDVINKEISEGIVLDLGKSNHIIGIEILDASKRIKLNQLLPINLRHSLLNKG